MIKSYRRNKLAPIALIFLGLLISLSIFREKTFVVVYDGFFLIWAILMLVMGFWGLVTPIAMIKKNKIALKFSLFTSKIIDLEQIREIGYDKNKQVLKFDSIEFKLKWMNSDCRIDFINDLKMIREQIMNE
jgi:hypothetical protein